MTAYDELRAMLADDGSRPFVTMHDLGTGERAELSVVSAMNAIAKMANLLVDELGLGPGDVVEVDLPLHWQAVGVIGGCWAAGVAVACGPRAGRMPGAPGASVAAAFIGQDRLERVEQLRDQVDEVFAVSLAPFGMPIRDPLPMGVMDLTTAVRVHGDRFSGGRPNADACAVTGGADLSHDEVLAQGRALAHALGLGVGGRCLIEEGAVVAGGEAPPLWLTALALPAVTRGSVVLVRSGTDTAPAELEQLLAQERVDCALLRAR